MTAEIDFDEISEDLLAFQEDEMVQAALHRGVDLVRYGRELEKELRTAETDTVMKYVENNDQVVNLHKQMQECDAVLARMQEMLLGFQADLGGISEEIKHLQDESLSLSIKLKNRRQAEDKLQKFLENASITPDMAANIVSPEVNAAFLESAIKLSSRLKYLQQTSPAKDGSSLDLAPAETFMGRTMLPELEKLKLRIISKAREYFTTQFNALRKPKTNVQVLQQSALVKYAHLLHFVQSEATPVAEDLRMMYIECMGRTLQNLFKSYSAQITKFELVIASKTDLIAVEEAALKSMFTQKVVNVSKRNDSFSLGDRDKILEEIEAEPILVHVAAAEGKKYPYEAILRSIVKHLSDAATNEFLFLIDFFKSNTRDTFNRIFGRTLSLVLENLENHLLNYYDCVGLLLMIKITHCQRLVMQRRRIPVLDSFFDRITMLLWPRFKHVFDANLKSIRLANPKRLGAMDLTPHYISKRYAELVASILIVGGGGGGGVGGSPSAPSSSAGSSAGMGSGDGSAGSLSGSQSHQGAGNMIASEAMGVGGGGDLMLQNDLQQMRLEIIAMLERLAQQIPDSKERKVFIINNYDQILSVFQERRITCEEVQKFDDLLMQQRELFAEEEIKGSFPRLISFVIQTEQAIAELSAATGGAGGGGGKGSISSLALDEAIVEALVREFASNWRTGIQHINDNVLAYFANFRNGMEILKQVLTQLLLYYTRFQDIIKKSWAKPPAFTRDIVSTATILMEIKKFSRSF